MQLINDLLYCVQVKVKVHARLKLSCIISNLFAILIQYQRQTALLSYFPLTVNLNFTKISMWHVILVDGVSRCFLRKLGALAAERCEKALSHISILGLPQELLGEFDPLLPYRF